MDERYNSREAEERLANYWEMENVYGFDPSSKSEIYAIDTPPPTLSGLIHLGHVFSYSQADFIARYKRMKGFSVFYPFGFDNNGLPTELLVEKKNKTTAEFVGREKFIEMVEKETKELEGLYRKIWTSVGISVDWSLLYSTISKEVQKISQHSFLELIKIGRAYRKETPTIWCPKCKTAVSQMELKDTTAKSKFVYIKFADDVNIATTRPELLSSVVAIFINPTDKQNAALAGRKVKVPIFGQEVEVKADARVDPKKGTGVVMCSTFGDLTDIEWYKAYNLDLRIGIDENGRMLDQHYKGATIKDARKNIIEDLKAAGYLISEKEIEHSVNAHERCGTEIEFLVKKQWFIKYLDMKDELIQLGNKINWYPSYMHVRYDNWINGLQWDWSVSRQRYYGIPFPVWYCKKCGEPLFAEDSDLPVNPMNDSPKTACKSCGSMEYMPEEDIMDTWATSSLTPLINARWGIDGKYDQVYPMSLRPQAHDIISFWLFTSVVKCYLHTGKVPWKDAVISGHGLDSNGKPMHKSLGNIVEPMPLIEKYGADALRHWASLSRLGEDSSYQEKDLVAGSKLVNKLWNVGRFVDSNCKNQGLGKNIMDKWILSRLMNLIKDVDMEFEAYNYAGAKRLIDEFFWFFCDNFLEFAKYRIYGDSHERPDFALRTVFLALLKMYAPFLPYITEDIYQKIFCGNDKRSIHRSEWPKYNPEFFDGESLEAGERACRVIAFIRQWKHNNKIALNAEITEISYEGELGDAIEDIKGAMKIKSLVKGKGDIEIPDTEVKMTITK